VKHIYLFALLLILGSCTLSSDQEQSLQHAVQEYIDARNEGILVIYTGYTHPNALDYYLSQSDEAFTDRFDLTPGPKTLFLQDGTMRDTEWDGDNIHIRYEFLGINEMDFNTQTRIVNIYAISIDDGASWHFMDEVDYMNDRIMKPKYRLIKKQ
jgi:hypothetical protein